MPGNKNSKPFKSMLHAIERGDAWWPLALIDELESKSTGSAFLLAHAFVAPQLHRYRCDESASAIRNEWLSELLALATKNPDSHELIRKAREVWYHEGTRDGAQTAIARLFEALGYLSQDDRGYRRALASAITVAASEEGSPIGENTISTMRDLYEHASM